MYCLVDALGALDAECYAMSPVAVVFYLSNSVVSMTNHLSCLCRLPGVFAPVAICYPKEQYVSESSLRARP